MGVLACQPPAPVLQNLRPDLAGTAVAKCSRSPQLWGPLFVKSGGLWSGSSLCPPPPHGGSTDSFTDCPQVPQVSVILSSMLSQAENHLAPVGLAARNQIPHPQLGCRGRGGVQRGWFLNSLSGWPSRQADHVHPVGTFGASWDASLSTGGSCGSQDSVRVSPRVTVRCPSGGSCHPGCPRLLQLGARGSAEAPVILQGAGCKGLWSGSHMT